MTREEGMELAKRIDAERPDALDYYLEVTGLKEIDFIEAIKKHRQGQMTTLPQDYPMREMPVAPSVRPAVVDLVEKLDPRNAEAAEAKTDPLSSGRPVVEEETSDIGSRCDTEFSFRLRRG